MPETTTDEQSSFSHSFKTLDEILDQFKKGSPSLEESLALFEKGVKHLKICQQKLSKAKGRVEELVESLQEDSEKITRPFNEAE